MKITLKIRLFVALLVSTLVLIVFLISGVWSIYSREVALEEEANVNGRLDLVKISISKDFQTMATFARHSSFETLLSLTEGSEETLRENMLEIAASTPEIDHLRVMDTSGMEKYRVNKKDGVPYLVDQADLQNKSKEFYFKNGLKLGPGEFYITPISLNRERDQIEQPIKPVTRILFPFYRGDGNGLEGLVCINMLANPLLDDISTVFANTGYDLFLAGKDGSLVMGPNLENLWANDLGHPRTFETLFPEVWQDIIAGDQETVATDQRTFYIRKIRFGPESDFFKATLLEDTPPIFTEPNIVTEYYLVIEAHKKTLFEFFMGSPYLYSLFLMFTVLVVTLFSWNGAVILARRQNTFQDLVDSEKQLKQITNTLVEGLVLFNGKGEIESINKTAEKIWGYSQEEVLGKNVSILMSEETAAFFHDTFNTYMKTGVSKILNKPPSEMVGRKKDGTTVYGDVAVTELNEDGKRIFIASVRDTTETRKLKAQFQVLTEEARDIVILNSRDLKPAYVSPAVRRVLGYSQEEYRNRKPFEFVHPDDLPRVLESHQALLKTKRQKSPVIFRMRKKNGTYIWAESVVRPVLDKEGNIESFISNIRDVTSRVEMEQDLRDSHKAEALGQIASGISHEFNNLLMAISGGLSLIKDGKNLDSTQREMIEMALKSSKRGADLVQSMLSYSKKQALRPVEISLADYLNKTVPKLKSRIKPGISLDLKLTKKAVAIYADPLALETVLFNLAENSSAAIKEKGQIEIILEERKMPTDQAKKLDIKPGTYIALKFFDSGKGIPPEDLEKAFDPFFTTKEVNEGKGLGLSMVYGFAQQSGGTVKIESMVGKGTIVTLYLPKA